MSFRPQQVWSQWTIQASMPVGGPSLSMQGSLPPSLSFILSLSFAFQSAPHFFNLKYAVYEVCFTCISYVEIR